MRRWSRRCCPRSTVPRSSRSCSPARRSRRPSIPTARCVTATTWTFWCGPKSCHGRSTLRSLGYTQRSHAELVHPSRLPVSLHTTLLPAPLAQNVADRVRSRPNSVTVAGRAAARWRRPTRCCTCARTVFSRRARRRSSGPSTPTSSWRGTPTSTGRCRSRRLKRPATVPFAVTLRFLHDELRPPCPDPSSTDSRPRRETRPHVALPFRCCQCGSGRGAGGPVACRRPPAAWVAVS